MCTQHPDNISLPFFAQNAVLAGDDEIKEAFYSFSHIGSNEQLWDCEGKEVDNFVVKKLLTSYEPYFRRHVLGKDKHLTIRVPNPAVEKNEAKIVLEVLESIPRNFDVNNAFYQDDTPPITEVFVPMVTKAEDVIRMKEYYKRFVVGKKILPVTTGDITVGEWIGKFKPDDISVTPLLEDKESMLNVASIVEKYVTSQKITGHQRVWFARSDPALNYSSTATVLIEKIALQRLHQLQEKLSVDFYPILGCGSAPFRGNMRPQTVASTLKAYPSVQTFTLQSSFRYDHPIREVRDAVDILNETKRSHPLLVEEEKILALIEKMEKAYQKQVALLAPMINKLSVHVPSRRKRKLHVGLFGYSRSQGSLQLPRAIPFVCSLYSVGLPPEILGLDAVDSKDVETIETVYPSFQKDYQSFMPYLNEDNLKYLPREFASVVAHVKKLFPYEENHAHKKITSIIMQDLGNENMQLVKENMERAAFVRGFLG
ncbi:phosphoenolpyruvate carboxylase [Candidatus Woesearchaeota archaeon]|nr:phosphoenolpyruvate carboxylase [Candidatus Woesearchaeota archaeon]